MIGCFNTTEGLFSEILGDFREEAKTDRDQVLMQCGELAHDNDYRVFALGFGGLCMSGADAQDKYYKYRQPGNKKKAKKCSNKIGQGPFSVVYSFGKDTIFFLHVIRGFKRERCRLELLGIYPYSLCEVYRLK